MILYKTKLYFVVESSLNSRIVSLFEEVVYISNRNYLYKFFNILIKSTTEDGI